MRAVFCNILLIALLLSAILACNKQKRAPLIATAGIRQYADTIFVSGRIYSKGDAELTETGICWSMDKNPTVNDAHAAVATTGAVFTGSIIFPVLNSKYFICTYATNQYGTVYGEIKEFRTSMPPVLSVINYSPDVNYLTIISSDLSTNVKYLQAGICWSTSAEKPNTRGPHEATPYPGASLTAVATGLDNNTEYFVRAYATTTAGTGYSKPVKMKTVYRKVKDQQGNEYRTVLINGKEWLADNFRSGIYADGSPIQFFPESSDWKSSAATAGACCSCNNSEVYEKQFGKLYNYHVITNPAGIAPAGWHVPTTQEWANLIEFVGDPPENIWTLQDGGTWASTNTTGMSICPSGIREMDGTFSSMDVATSFWALPSGTSLSKNFYFSKHYATNLYDSDPGSGCSLRLVRD